SGGGGHRDGPGSGIRGRGDRALAGRKGGEVMPKRPAQAPRPQPVRRGDVVMADLIPGSEQTGRRPALVISHDGFNLTPGWRSLILVPLSTSAAQARRGLTSVLLSQ